MIKESKLQSISFSVESSSAQAFSLFCPIVERRKCDFINFNLLKLLLPDAKVICRVCCVLLCVAKAMTLFENISSRLFFII